MLHPHHDLPRLGPGQASLSDRSAQKIRNDVQGDWLTASAVGGES